MKIFYGPKGTGKTKAIIDSATNAVKDAKGHVVFITDTNRYSFDLKYPIRFLNTEDFNVSGEDGLLGFVSGIVAANGDNEYVFIDGVARIANKNLKDMQAFFDAIEKLEKDFGVKFVLTCSSSKEDLPDFILKWAK